MISNAEKYGTYMLICDKVALAHAGTMDGVFKVGFSFVTLKEPVFFSYQGKDYPIQFVIALSADNSMTHLTAMGEVIDLVCRTDKLEEILKIDNINRFLCFIEENCGKT